jgi:hypothetical protein
MATNSNRQKKQAEEVRDKHAVIKPFTQTLLDLRGSIPVSGKQDFDAIRKQVLAKQGNAK